MPAGGGGAIITTSPSPSVILATIIENLPANSNKTDLSIYNAGGSNVTVSLSASGCPGTPVFDPSSVTVSGGFSANVVFNVKNIPGSTASQQCPVKIKAAYDSSVVETTVLLKIEKVTTTWKEI